MAAQENNDMVDNRTGRSARPNGSGSGPSQRVEATLGVLLPYIGDAYSNLVLAGMVDYTQAHDLSLGVVLVDGFVTLEDELGAYGLVSPDRFDGIVLTGGLAYREHQSLERLGRLRRQNADLPMVSLSVSLESDVSVTADGYGGMYQAVEHLIEAHGYRRIGFIGGPESSFEAQARYRAYADALAEHGIAPDKNWMLPGDFSEDAGVQGVQTFLRRGTELDALVCSNDDTAVGALEVLNARNVRIPEDLALVGFDDVAEASQLPVPLTTVRQPIFEMGRQSAEALHALIRGEGGVEDHVISTELVVRRSCGCLPSVVREVAAARPQDAHVESLSAETIADRLDAQVRKLPRSESIALAQNLIADLTAPESNAFVEAFDRLLSRLQREGRDLSEWQHILTSLRRMILQHVDLLHQRQRVEDMLQQARILVGQADARKQAYQQSMVDRRVEALEWFYGQAASLTSLDDLASRLAYTLPRVQIDACYLSTFVDADGSPRPADDAALDLGFVEGEGGVDTGGRFRAHRLVPDAVWDARFTSSPTVFAALPMSVGEEDFGISVFCGRPDDFGVSYRLREAVTGIALRAGLLEEQRAAIRDAEEQSRRAEDALRDALVAQRRYTQQAWEVSTASIRGYRRSAEDAPEGAPVGEDERETVWLAGMESAVQEVRPVVESRDGSETLALPLTLFGEEVIGALGFARDGAEGWTEGQIRMAQSVAEQVSLALENQRLISDVQRRAARLTAASEVSRAATALTDLDEQLPEVVDLIRERFDLYYAGVFLVDDAREWAVLVAGTGEAGQTMLAQGHRLKVGGQSMIGSCAATGDARITYDARREERRRPNPLLPETRSELALPLISRGEVIGAMTIQDERPGAFTEDDITTLQTMAAQLANAVTNTQLLERMEENLQELRAATGQYTEESWRDYLAQTPGTRAYRYRMIDFAPVAERRPEAESALKRDETVVTGSDGEASRADRTEVPEDSGSGVGVPIRLRDRTLGVLNVRFEDEEVPEETVQLVEQVADRLAISLESARLLAEMRRTAQREHTVGEVTDRMRRTLDWDDLMQTTTEELRDLLSASRVFVQWKAPSADSTDEGVEV